MPPRWPREPDRKNDPDYRKLDDRMTFAVHVATFALFNSSLWFFHNFLSTDWEWLPILTLSWLGILFFHLIYISVIADYSNNPPEST